jgi:hypothetical protein
MINDHGLDAFSQDQSLRAAIDNFGHNFGQMTTL